MLQSLRKLRVTSWTHRPLANIRWYSDDDEKPKKQKEKGKAVEKPKEKKIQNKESLDRLKMLLESMPSSNSNTKVEIPLAPKKKSIPKEKSAHQRAGLEEITKVIAKKIGGDTSRTESELLSKLLGQPETKHEGSLSDLISGMVVDVEKKSKKPDTQQPQRNKEYNLAEGVRRSLGPPRDRRPPRRSESAPSSGVVNLFGAEPLGLFDKASDEKDPLETWSKLQQRELKLAVTHPPRNYFEKMIVWTEQGKLWKFPIDNEQGMDEEFATDFSEHVLLEMHLDGWCPPSGPIRHFMELVCVGLGKNNFMTAQEKKDHIFWYKQYFEEKKDLLGDLMVMGIQKEQPQLES